ncbi:LCP family protein [Oceanispirochaeta sp.]|jgi:anionic cell wall polymer biosynthesis LytR-Cps2A-Psr (LCP) family protein|uniref:LCP family protein n=1 Tax=Oceanispirochaeta sp. TaxID=2035350 RepID=UPI00262FBBA9|nr:LCP family protein [Oceanispirochaeta sp.]MDA3955329.1 LCP family protein [Oceanispirochaeta sp.]
MKDRRAPDLSLLLLILIFLILAGLSLYILLTMKIDDYKEMINDHRLINTVLIIEKDGRPIVTELYYYHPETKKGALLNIPEETGALIRSLNRVDRIDTLYNSEDPSYYLNQIGLLTGIEPDFFIQIKTKALVSLVDYIEGIEIFLPNPVEVLNENRRILLPSGSVNLDGDKALDYLIYRIDGESSDERIKREHELILGILKKLNLMYSPRFSESFIEYIYPEINTNLDDKSLDSFLHELASLEVDRVVFQQVLGTSRKVDSQILYFPHYDGKLLRETVKQMQDSLSDFDVLKDEKLILSLEIQNGTSRNGLGSRTAQVFKSYGYEIASVKNADSNRYENTVILDKKGDPAAAQRVANLIKCQRIFTDVDQNRDETVDIIIILGKDFDGRYVK